MEGDRALSLTLGQLPGVELHAFHTLRSGIPKSKLLGQWSDFVRVPHDTNKEVSFIVLSDPRFSQASHGSAVACYMLAFSHFPSYQTKARCVTHV